MDEAITDSSGCSTEWLLPWEMIREKTQQNTDKNTNPTLMDPVIAVIDVIQW